MPSSISTVSRRQLLTRGGAGLACAMLAPNLVLGAQDAREVAQAINDVERTARYSALAEVQLLRVGSQPRTRDLEVSAARQGSESLSLRRYVFSGPADIRGTKLLVHENAGNDNSLWLLLPSVGKVRRISSSNQSNSFAGTDFTYSNLMTLDLDQFSHAITGASGGNLTLESTVKTARFGQNIGYARAVTEAASASMLPSRIDYYDARGRLLKTQTMSAATRAPDGKFILQSRHMVVHGEGRETRIRLSQIDFSPNFDGGHFRSQSL
jgi:uncharacterized protein